MNHVEDESEVNEDRYDQPGHANTGNIYLFAFDILIGGLHSRDMNLSLCMVVKIGKCIHPTCHLLTINQFSYDLLVYANSLSNSFQTSQLTR